MMAANFSSHSAYHCIQNLVFSICAVLLVVSAPASAQSDAVQVSEDDPLSYAKEARLCRQVHDPEWVAGRSTPTRGREMSETYNAWDDALKRGVWWSVAYGYSLFTLDDGLPHPTRGFFGTGERFIPQATKDKCVFDPARHSPQALSAQDRHYAPHWQAERAKNYPPKTMVPATSDLGKAREAGWCMSAATLTLSFLQDTPTLTGMRKANPGFFRIDPSTENGRTTLNNEITKYTRVKEWWNARRESLRSENRAHDKLLEQSTRFNAIFAWLNRSDQSGRDARAIQLLYVQGENRRCDILMGIIARQ